MSDRVGMGDEDVGNGLALERRLEGGEVGGVIGTGIDHRDLARPNDIRARAEVGERAGVVGDHPPDLRGDLVDPSVLELQLTHELEGHGTSLRGGPTILVVEVAVIARSPQSARRPGQLLRSGTSGAIVRRSTQPCQTPMQ